MADQNTPATQNDRIAPSTTYQVEGKPEDYRYVLKGEDLVLINKETNEEQVFLFVGNIMSMDGQVNMSFSSGQSLDSRGLFERAEMVEIEPHAEDTQWATADDEEEPDEDSEGNSSNPDAASPPPEQPSEQDAQAAPLEDLKEQVLEAAHQQNTFTSNNQADAIRNENVSPTVNTNTGDKQNVAQEEEEEEQEPIEPSIAPPHLELFQGDATNPTHDTGISSTDFITSKTDPKFVGTAVAGSVVKLFIDDKEVGSDTADKDGAFTILLPEALKEGSYSIYATSEKYGLKSQSSTEELVIDETAPDLPTLTLDENSDLGFSQTDGKTNTTTPTFEGAYTGTAEDGTILTIVLENDATGEKFTDTTTVQAGGKWSYTVPEGELANIAGTADGAGSYTVSLKAEDKAGNTATSSSTIKVDLDVTAPTLDEADLKLDEDSANILIDGTDSDFITKDKTFTLSGTAETGAKVTVFINGTASTAKVAADGTWSFTAAELGVTAEGDYKLKVQAEDEHGNVTTTPDKTLVIDTSVVNTGVSIEGMTDAVDGYHYVGNGTPTFNLSGEATSTGVLTIVDKDGNTVHTENVIWDGSTTSATITPVALADGSYTGNFTQTDAAGNTRTESVQFKVDQNPPPSPDQIEVNDTGTDQVVPVTNNPEVTITFTDSPDLDDIKEVRVYIDGSNPPADLDSGYKVATRDGADKNTWTLEYPEWASTFAEGNHTFTVVVVDQNGRTDVSTGTYESTNFVFDSVDPELTDIELETGSGAFTGIPDDYKVDADDPSLTAEEQAAIESGTPVYVVPVNPSFSGTFELETVLNVKIETPLDAAAGSRTFTPEMTGDQWSVRFGDSGNATEKTDSNRLIKDALNKVTITSVDKAGNTTTETIYIKVLGDPPDAPDVWLDEDYDTGFKGDHITQGNDDDTTASDADGKIRLEGEAENASYVIITGVSYVDESGVTHIINPSIVGQKISVDSTTDKWSAPEMLLEDLSSTLHQGTKYTFTVRAYNAANQASDAQSYDLTVDRTTTTSTLDLESDSSGPADSDSIDYGPGLTDGTKDNRTSLTMEGKELTFSGTNAEDGSNVYLVHTAADGTVTALDAYSTTVSVGGPETGSWILKVDMEAAGIDQDGEHTFVVRTTDPAGNVQDSAPLVVTLDSTAPTVGDIALASDDNSAIDQRFVDANPDLATDNNGYKTDTITNHKNFTLTGTLDAEANDEAGNVEVKVFEGTTYIGLATVVTDASGNASWTYDYDKDVADGNYTFHVKVTDRAGNTTKGNDITVTVDTTAPTITSFGLEDADDSFYDAVDPADDLGTNTDDYTGAGSLTLEGKSDVDAPVLIEYSTDGGTTYTALYAIPNGTANTSGTDAAHSANWTQDGAGNWSYTVDAETLKSGLGTSGTETVLFRATASDSAGNEISDSFSVDVDRTAPAGTTIDLDVGSDSVDTIGTAATIGGTALGSNDDNRTNEDSILLTGTAEKDARVEIYRVAPGSDFSDASRGTLLDVVTADNTTGGWNYTHAFDTNPTGGVDADGEYEFVAVAVDKAGNRGTPTILEVHRDTDVEASSTLNVNASSVTQSGLPADAGESAANPLITAGTYRVNADSTTYLDKSYITLEGTLSGDEADAVAAYVYKDGTLVGQATISGSGWTYNATSLADGATYAYTLRLEDAAGNTTDTAPVYVKIDSSTAAPTVDLITADDSAGNYFYLNTADPDVGDTDNVTNDDTFILNGTVAEAGSSVTLFIAARNADGTFGDYKAVTGTITQPASDGTSWSYTVPDSEITEDGVYRIKAVAKDLAGNTADQTLDITVDQNAPGLLETKELWLDNDSGAADQITNADTLKLHGRLSDTSDQDIVLYIKQDGGTPQKVTTIDWSTGEWSFEYTPAMNGTAGVDPSALPEGEYKFVLYAEDRAGNLTTYPASGSYDVTLDRSLTTPSIDLAGGADTYGGPADVDLDGDGTIDGAEDDYTAFVEANGTDIHLNITADTDDAVTVAVYVKDPTEGDVAFDPANPENGYDLYQGDLKYNTADGKWDTVKFDASGYQNDTNEVTLVVVANDGSQEKHSTYTFTIDDEAPQAVVGDEIDWAPADAGATHITAGVPVTNATNDKAVVLSGAVQGEGPTDVTVEIFDHTKASRTDTYAGKPVSIGFATVNPDGTWTFTAGSDVSPVDEAYHRYTAKIEDKAGNVTEVTMDELLVDRTTPATPGLVMAGTQDTDYTDGLTETDGDGYYVDGKGTASTLDDVYYNDNATTPFNLSGLEVSPGSTLSISIDGGAPQTIAITSGTYAYTPPSALTNGNHTIEAHVTDAAGNVSNTSAINFVVDTVNPTITDVTLDPDSNTGSADDTADPVTKATNPKITGKSESEAAIKVELRDDMGTASTADDKVYVVSTVADVDGNWSVTVPEDPTVSIATGNYTATVTAIDKAGNTTIEENATSFEVNRDVDVVSDSFVMVENEVNDTGFADDDQYTANNNPSFSWQANEDVEVRLVFYKDGIATPVRTAVPTDAELSTSGGVTTWTPTILGLADGKYTVKAVFTDTEAGNQTDPDDHTVDFTVDTTSTSLSAELADASDTGVENDWVTNPALTAGGGTTVTLTGSAPSGTTPATEVRVQVFSKGADGSRTLLTPQGVAGDYVNIDGSGNWTYNVLASALVDGDNNLIFVSTDLAGNTTEIEHTLEVDTTLDPGNVILAANDTVDEVANGGLNNSGTYAEDGDFTDNKTNDTTPRLTGTTEPGSTVELWLGDPDAGGTRIATNVPTDADGNWYFDVNTDTRTDADGDALRVGAATLTDTSADRDGTDYVFTARVTDRAGNVQDATGTVVIDTQAPDETASNIRISTVGTPEGGTVTYSDTGLDHTDGYTSDTTPTLTGSVAEGNSRVDVYVTYPGDAAATLIGTTKALASGAWTLEFPNSAMPLAGSPGGTDYKLSVKTWDDAGNESAFSNETTVTIDNGFADLDSDIAGTQPALIRFGEAFDASNPADAVFYDPADHTLKSNITTPVFDVTLEPNCDTATLTIIRLGSDGNPVTSPVADKDVFTINLGPGYTDNPPADGKWTGIQFENSDGSVATINGNWKLTVSGTDKAGNEFEQDQSLVINGIPPEFSLVIDEDQTDATGVGLYAVDNIIGTNTVHFSGTFGADVDPDEVKRVSIINSVDNSVVATLEDADITDRTWRIEASSLPAGANTYSFFIKSEDNFGNEYWYPSAVDPLTYTVDLNAPVLNEDSVDLVAADDSTGIFYAANDDNSTTEREVDINFGGETDSKVELLLDGTVLFTAMPPNPTDAGGAYTYALGTDALTGTLPAGVTYNSATNRYTYTSSTLADGEYTFQVRVTDLAGNTSTEELVVTVDNEYKDVSLTGDLASDSDNGIFGDNLVGSNDNLSNEDRPELSGSAEPGSAVRVYLQRFDSKAEAEADTTFAVGDADWYKNTPHTEIKVGDDESSWSWNAVQQSGANAGDDLSDGYYKVIVVSEDKAGNQPTPETFVFGKDTDAPSETTDPDALTFHLQDKVENPDLLNEGSSSAGEVQEGDKVDADGDPIWVTSNWMPTIGGVAETGSRLTIVLRIDGDGDGDIDDPTAIYKQLTIDVTDPDGKWSFDFAGEETGAGRLADGIYTAEVTCTDPAGNETELSPAPQFQISSIPPSPPTIRLHPDDDSYDSQTSSDGITNKNTGLTLTGTAEAGATVRLYRSSAVADTGDLITDAYLAANLVVTLTADASGTWTYEIPENDPDSTTDDPSVVDDGSYRYFVAGDYFNGNTYYSMQATNGEGQAVLAADGKSPVLKQPTEILDDDGNGTGKFTYPDYVMEVDTDLPNPTLRLGMILDTDTSLTEEERKSNSSRTDSGIDNEWLTPEEKAAGKYLGEDNDFWQTPDELAAEGHGDSTYNDWTVKSSGPTIEGEVEAGSIVYIDRWMKADLTDDGVDNAIEQWVQVGVVEQESTSEGTWRYVFPAEFDNAQYDVRIRAVDKAGNEFIGTTANGGRRTITIDAVIKDTVLDLPDVQDTELAWDGVAFGTAWASIATDANLVLKESDGSTRVLDYVEKSHLGSDFESGNTDDLTSVNNLLLSGEVEAGSRMYITDTNQGVTAAITPVFIVDPAAALGDDTATEAFYVKVNDAGDVGTWVWKSAASFLADHGADYDGVYFHINADGTWQYRTGELADAKHAYTIENIDLAGNRAVTTPLAVTIDNEFAEASIAISQNSDNGPFNNDDPAYDDNITNDSTPSFRLYGESGSTYLLYAYHVNADGTIGANVNADGTPVKTGIHANGEDTWVTLDLADGGYQLRLVNVSESGHVKEAIYPPTEADGTYVTDEGWDERSTTHPLVIDTDIPDIPTQAEIEANTAKTGDYYVHLKDGDTADPINVWSTPVLMDNGQPLPVIVSGDAFDVHGNGLETDLITNDSSPTLQIFVEPGTMIAVSGMGYNSYLTDTDNDGIITLDPSNARNDGNPYANGTYDFTVRFGDIAGNVNGTTANFSVTIDTAAPGTNIDLTTPSDTGSFSVDNLTNDSTPTISGRVAADAVRYEIRIGGTVIERNLGDSDYGTLVDGYYEWTYTPTLANGEYSVSTRAWDRAGNAGGSSLSAYHPDSPDTVTHGVPLIVHNTGDLDLYATCEENRSGSRIYLDIDYSTSDAYNDPDNVYAGPNKLVFTYHYTDKASTTETVEMTLGESDYSLSLKSKDNYSSIEFKLVDSAGNESKTATVDIVGGDPDDDGVYTINNVTGGIEDIPAAAPAAASTPADETTSVSVELAGDLTDDNAGDSLHLSDVETIRATITGDLDGDGDNESMSVNADVADDGSWSLNFRQELAAGDFDLDLSALKADGTEVELASTTDLNYDFTVLTESMATAAGEPSQVLFDAAAENSEPAPPSEPTPGTANTVTIDVEPVVIEEHTI